VELRRARDAHPALDLRERSLRRGTGLEARVDPEHARELPAVERHVDRIGERLLLHEAVCDGPFERVGAHLERRPTRRVHRHHRKRDDHARAIDVGLHDEASLPHEAHRRRRVQDPWLRARRHGAERPFDRREGCLAVEVADEDERRVCRCVVGLVEAPDVLERHATERFLVPDRERVVRVPSGEDRGVHEAVHEPARRVLVVLT
jgi:hypothetical protein